MKYFVFQLSLEKTEWQVLAEADQIAQQEKLREIQRQRDTEIYIERMREMERVSDIERQQVRMREWERMRDIERKRERELVEELTRKEMKQEENVMKDMKERLYDRQRTLEKQLEEQIRKMDRENETRDKEMRLKVMEEKCARAREMEQKRQKERVRESESKRQQEGVAKILEMERKLEKTRVMTQRREEGLLGQIEHEQETKMEAPRHIETTMRKERLRHLDIQREPEQVKEECQDMGSEIRRERDRESTLREHIEISERRLDTERRELEKQQEMKKQLKKMEQKFEMERKRHDERWRETEEKKGELERMLEAERKAAQRRDQELLKLREELEKEKQEKLMKMERQREIEREEKRTTVREKEHEKKLKPRGRNAARKTSEDERLTEVTKQDTKEVKNLWNEGMNCAEEIKLKVVKGKREGLQEGQQIMDEELFIKKERMSARKNKMEGEGEREMEGQQMERCGQLDEEINRNFEKEREMEQKKSEERCSELRKSRQKKRKEKAQELEKQRKQEEEDAVQEDKKKCKKKTLCVKGDTETQKLNEAKTNTATQENGWKDKSDEDKDGKWTHLRNMDIQEENERQKEQEKKSADILKENEQREKAYQEEQRQQQQQREAQEKERQKELERQRETEKEKEIDKQREIQKQTHVEKQDQEQPKMEAKAQIQTNDKPMEVTGQRSECQNITNKQAINYPGKVKGRRMLCQPMVQATGNQKPKPCRVKSHIQTNTKQTPDPAETLPVTELTSTATDYPQATCQAVEQSDSDEQLRRDNTAIMPSEKEDEPQVNTAGQVAQSSRNPSQAQSLASDGSDGEEMNGGEEQAENTSLRSADEMAQEEIPADAESIETGQSGWVQKERSVRRKVFGWVNEKAKNYYQKKIDRTHVREEEEGHIFYLPCKISDMFMSFHSCIPD